MLRPQLMFSYQILFDRAEHVVAADSVCLARVQRSRLPLLYAELEILRDNPLEDSTGLEERIAFFERQCSRFGITVLNEKGNTVAQYGKLYHERFMNRRDNLSQGARVTYQIAPSSRYMEMCKTALTDGVLGSYLFRKNWVGWEGTDASFTLDLGEEKGFSSIDTDFLLQDYHWIYMPRSVTYEVSADGIHFTEPICIQVEEDHSKETKLVSVKHVFPEKQRARYIHVEVEGKKVFPAGLCWFFIDEVIVK